MKNPSLPPKLEFACPKRWQDMRVDGDRRRFCEQCQLHVHDLSAMTPREGETFLAGVQGRCCVSFESRPDGSLVTRGRWTALDQRWQRVRRAVVALFSLAAPFALGACEHPRRETMSRTGGVICVDPKSYPQGPPEPASSPGAQMDGPSGTPMPGGWPPPDSATVE